MPCKATAGTPVLELKLKLNSFFFFSSPQNQNLFFKCMTGTQMEPKVLQIINNMSKYVSYLFQMNDNN